MNRNIIWGLLAIIIVAMGIWFFQAEEEAVNAPETQNQQEENGNGNPAGIEETAAVVIYTDAGYSPSELRVNAGRTVIFRNASTQGMWTASAPHPTHTDYPAFDSKTGTPAGDDYSFTFTETGTYRYHNHLQPSHFGRVIVE